MNILICGIAGASLGTELLKCLKLAGQYRVFGCDISRFAYGMYDPGFEKTCMIRRDTYIDDVLAICQIYGIDVVVPGAEEPASLLSASKDAFERKSVLLACNNPEVVSLCSDKSRCFDRLAQLGFRIPRVITGDLIATLPTLSFPLIIKPSTGSGGSAFVFLAQDTDEASMYLHYLNRNGKSPIIQEYLPETEGEFTVGTLALGTHIGSIALRRIFDNKLSVLMKSKAGLISTGYSQGQIGDYPEVRQQCEKIARAIGSTGPLNIQGRVVKGEFVPFEINPRFSASSYLRALAGFNEVDVYLRYLKTGVAEVPENIRSGYYLRSLTEEFIPSEELK